MSHISLTIECLVTMLVEHLQDQGQGNLLLVVDLDLVLIHFQDDALKFVLGLLRLCGHPDTDYPIH